MRKLNLYILERESEIETSLSEGEVDEVIIYCIHRVNHPKRSKSFSSTSVGTEGGGTEEARFSLGFLGSSELMGFEVGIFASVMLGLDVLFGLVWVLS